MTSTAWPLRSLRNCARFLSGGTPSKARADFWDGDIPWVSSGEMTELRIYDTPLHINEEGAIDGSRLVPANTVLTVVRGMSLAKEFRIALTRREMAFNQDIKALACEADVASEFLFYALLARRGHIRELASEASHGTKRLETEVLSAFQVPVPRDLKVQRRVVAILSAYDDLIENNRRRIALLEEAARRLYNEWFFRRRFPGHEHTHITNGVPEGWRPSTLGAVTKNSDRLRVPLSVFEREVRPGPYPYHGAAGVLDHIDGFIFEGKYLLVGEDGTVQTATGTPMLQFVEGKFWVSNHAHVIQGREVSTEFLYCLLAAYPIAGHVTGVAQPKLTQANLNRIPVLIPPIVLSDQFQVAVEPMFAQRFMLKAEVEVLLAARNLLLPRLMSGDLAV